MNRRNALKGMAAIGLLTILPKWLFQSKTVENPIHIIGLGGAGCNALEYMYKRSINAKYTCITSPVRQHLPGDIKFIKFESPKIIFTKKSGIKMPLPDEINALFTPHNKYILLAGLGSYTGTNLLRAIMDKLIEQSIDFKVICSLPFNFEGAYRKNTANQIVSEYNNLNNFWHFDLEKLKNNMNCKIVSEAFKIADKRYYEILTYHLS